ncbi:MAG TPA: hypothetical protein PKK10_15115 [Woeseiaceae bacterium]|nr:hypothetical protein [Woeseiaceae bacterium]
MSTQDPIKPNEATEKPAVSRRAVLRASVATVPTILTLQSGAALARSSNVISASPVATTDRFGRTLCLDPRSVDRVRGSGNLYDLGDPASARISAIRDRDYRRAPMWQAARVRESAMCKDGGAYYYKPWGRRWQEVNVRQGIIVSATALTSFSSNIVVTDL